MPVRGFPNFVTDKVWRRRHLLVDTLQDWHRVKDELLPHWRMTTSISAMSASDRTIVVLDWELVQRNIAQRDLVEMLTFVLPSDVDRSRIDRHVEAHRNASSRPAFRPESSATPGSRASDAS